MSLGLRAYLLIKARDSLDQDQFIRNVVALEDMPEVDFVDVVVGTCDVVVMAECPVSVDAFANKVRTLDWVEDLEVLRIVSIYERHRASKKDLLKALKHSGL